MISWTDLIAWAQNVEDGMFRKLYIRRGRIELNERPQTNYQIYGHLNNISEYIGRNNKPQ